MNSKKAKPERSYPLRLRLPDGRVNLFKAFISRLQILNNTVCQNIRDRQIAQVSQAFILYIYTGCRQALSKIDYFSPFSQTRGSHVV